MRFIFERFENVATGKVATLGDDGSIRQFPYDPKNMRQQWLRTLSTQPSDGTFRIRCRATGKVLGFDFNNLLRQDDQDFGASEQRWDITPTDEDPNVFFIGFAGKDKVWDVPGGSPTDGLNLQAFPFNGGNNQRWRIRISEAIEQVFKIRSEANNLLIEVPGLSQDNGEPIQQWADNGGFHQLWYFVPASNDAVTIRSVCSGKVIDYPLSPATHNQPATVSQYARSDSSNQWWRVIVPGSGNIPNMNPGAIVSIRSAFSPTNGFFLDVPNGSGSLGVKIQAYGGNGTAPNEKWRLILANPNAPDVLHV